MSTSSIRNRQVIAIAGAGDLGRYICEEILASPDFSVVILTRSVKHPPQIPLRNDKPTLTFQTENKWFTTLPHPTAIHQTNYTLSSLLPILDATHATALVSFLNIPDPSYIAIHAALLTACAQSATCKRLIPSEWAGDSERYPDKPAYYATSRLPFRTMLARQAEVEWTLVNCGWLAEYFLPARKSYMAPIKGKFPVDPDGWAACLRGRRGEEMQSWTCASDVGRAVVELCRVPKGGWERWTFVAGEWSSFEEAVKTIERFYGRPMPRTYKSSEEIRHALAEHAGDDPISEELETAQVEEMMVEGYMTCPKEKTLMQRDQYFKDISFMCLKQLLQYAEARDHV
ncbi:MAG: hypothetical protein Q9196_000700 [Gyalolechia fulgens]